jgi:hypothetical protein
MGIQPRLQLRVGARVAERLTHPLTPSEQRKRALVDAASALVLTMLLWPFPIARAMLAPVWNVLFVLLTWLIVGLVYHVVCARFWRRTAAMYLLGYALETRVGSHGEIDNAVAIRWGLVAGALVVLNAVWAPTAAVVESASGAELRRSEPT